MRNFLFGNPGDGGFDLAALNLQRGRDHGLADYNTVRKAYHLQPVKTFAQITSDQTIRNKLAQAYDSVDDMDLWVVGLAEDHVRGGLVGETFHAILVDQFKRLRDGDRFWYRNDPFFTSRPKLLKQVEGTKLIDIIRRNTDVGGELRGNIFIAD